MSEPFKSLEEIHLALNVCWSFDDDQQHTHTWHDKQDFLDRLTLTLQTHELREKPMAVRVENLRLCGVNKCGDKATHSVEIITRDEYSFTIFVCDKHAKKYQDPTEKQ